MCLYGFFFIDFFYFKGIWIKGYSNIVVDLKFFGSCFKIGDLLFS